MPASPSAPSQDELKPLCFVVMPYGTKPDPTGRGPIDFDTIYAEAVRPAIIDAGLHPIRADQERSGGVIHRAMFERLMLCEYAVVDLTTSNANVFYELGVRHTARPRTTQAIHAKHHPLPFNVNLMRSLGYELGPNNEAEAAYLSALRRDLRERLGGLKDLNHAAAPLDSPVFQLLEGEWAPELPHLRADSFADRSRAHEAMRQRIDDAVSQEAEAGIATLQAVERELGELEVEEIGVIGHLFLAYRALGDPEGMIRLYEGSPAEIRTQDMFREQYAFALNREAGRDSCAPDRRRALRKQALRILEEVEDKRGTNPETCGLIGRIYKDQWDEARRAGNPVADGHLEEAIAAYLRGFEADWRDTYPGINAATLLEIEGSDESLARRRELAPVVRFAQRRLIEKNGTKSSYWDHATMLELSVLDEDPAGARTSLKKALGGTDEAWMLKSTARNLGLIEELRRERNEDTSWIAEIVAALRAHADAIDRGD